MKLRKVHGTRQGLKTMLRSKHPVVVIRGNRIAGVFFPCENLPVNLKLRLFDVLSSEIALQIRKRGLSEKEIMVDFKSWRRNNRANS